MRVRILATGKVEERSAAYGARLIEQGKAVIAPPPVPRPAKTGNGKAARRAAKTPCH